MLNRTPSGRSLILRHLLQTLHYSGLTEGCPSEKTNNWHIDAAIDRAQKCQYTIGTPYLIEPTRRDYLREPGDMDRMRNSPFPKSFGKYPEWLPVIECIGCFKSSSTTGNVMNDSFLTIVWFQNDFARPIPEDILERILSLDWDSLSTDIET